MVCCSGFGGFHNLRDADRNHVEPYTYAVWCTSKYATHLTVAPHLRGRRDHQERSVIRSRDFLALLKEPFTRFTDIIFRQAIGSTSSATLTFGQFVTVVIVMCLFNKTELYQSTPVPLCGVACCAVLAVVVTKRGCPQRCSRRLTHTGWVA